MWYESRMTTPFVLDKIIQKNPAGFDVNGVTISASPATNDILLGGTSVKKMRPKLATPYQAEDAVNNWTTQTIPNLDWTDVTWSSELNLFVAVASSGTGNRVMTSPDGATWTTRVSVADNNWTSLTWSKELSLFVAVAQTGTGNRVMTSSNGITWGSQLSPADISWRAVLWVKELSLFVAVASTGTGNRIATSPNGINWTIRDSPADNDWYSLAWSAELSILVAVASSGTGNRIATSTNAVTWITQQSPADNNWTSVTWGPEVGLFVAVANTGTGNRVATSQNGILWTTRFTMIDNNWNHVAWAPELGLFLAIALTDNLAITSLDGISWTTRAFSSITLPGSVWTHQDRLQASDPGASDNFGSSVALSSDGNTLAVGAYFDDHSALTDPGSTYIFTRSGSTWTQQARLQASDPGANDNFGSSVALSSDGNTLAVGAYYDDHSALSDPGSTYIFTRSGSTWTQQARLQASDPGANDYFGFSVALSSDGNTLAVGAYYDDHSAPKITDAGSVYVFTRAGATWTQQARLQASDPGAYDYFGFSVALSSDGNTLAVGAYLDDHSALSDPGSTYIFTRSGSTWTQQARLQASDPATNDYFGNSVALSSDGNTLAVCAYADDHSALTNPGSTYIFTRSGSTWTQQARLQASDPGDSDWFGTSVALSSDGNTLAVGAYLDDHSALSDPGSTYIFTRSGSTWTQQARLQASDPGASDQFGISVALSSDGNTLAVGARLDDHSALSDPGSTYIFTRSILQSDWTSFTWAPEYGQYAVVSDTPYGRTSKVTYPNNDLIPAGTVIYVARNTPPTGYIKANGTNISRSTFNKLFTAIGTTFGVGDGSTTFTLPDLRGEFVRGWDDSRGIDTSRTFGSAQTEAMQNHTHSIPVEFSPTAYAWGASVGGAGWNKTGTSTSGNPSTGGGTETRPRNVALLVCIKT